MVVYTLQQHGRTVDKQLIFVGYADFTHTHLERNVLGFALDNHGVKVRLFRIPEYRRVKAFYPFAVGVDFIVLRVNADCFCVSLDKYVLYVTFLTREKIYISENSVKAEEILILKIAAHAPFKNLGTDNVFALGHIAADVKLRLKVRALRAADIFAVYVKVHTR